MNASTAECAHPKCLGSMLSKYSSDAARERPILTAFVITSAHQLLASRAVPLVRHIYSHNSNLGHSTTLVIEDRTMSTPSVLHDLNCEQSADGITPFGRVWRCARLPSSQLLMAKGCSSTRHDDVGIACKAERGLLYALHGWRWKPAVGDDGKQPAPRWVVLCDDDAWWHLGLLQQTLVRFDPSRSLAFGFYSCGNLAGMPRCVRNQAFVPRLETPNCFAVFAVLSVTALMAIAPALQRGFLQGRTESLNAQEKAACTVKCQYYMHDTALGFALWLVGVESGSDLAEISGPLNKCVNLSESAPKRPCAMMHAHSREITAPSHSRKYTYETALQRTMAITHGNSKLPSPLATHEYAYASRRSGSSVGGAVPRGCHAQAFAAGKLRATPAARAFLVDCIGVSMFAPHWL